MLKLCRKPLPIIGKISEMLLPGSYPGFLDIASSPRGPLDLKLVQCSSPSSSPRNLKSYDVVGVGLGIVAALDKKSTHDGRENRTSDPVPVISNGQKSEKGEEEEDSEENYTFVTFHHGSNKSVTKVYYDGGDYCSTRSNEQHVGFVTCNVTNETLSENHERKRDHVYYPTSEFLSSCNLCSKKLDGLDIYMYRGDKAFCSSECRATLMMNDERKESQCRSEASRRSTDVSNSREKIFFFSTAILAV